MRVDAGSESGPTGRATRVVTKRGDSGETLISPGQRGLKDAPRVEACGTIDELGACLGCLRAAIMDTGDLATMLRDVQIDLFHVGATLFGVTDPSAAFDVRLERIERQLDAMNAAMPRLANFILAGGTEAAAFAHLTRAVARRAERVVVTMGRSEPVDPAILRYLNRLSDYLFVVARRVNGNGTNDDLWAPHGAR